MFRGSNWISDWCKAELFSLRVGEICSTIPVRGSWEPNDRVAFSMASFRLAKEHHSSIHLLISNDKSASARALTRPMLEAALRVIWIAEDAGEQEIINLTKGRGIVPLLGELNACLKKRGEPMGSRFQGLLHSFTHGGHMALGAQFLEGEKLEQSNAAIVAVAGTALAGAGYMISSLIGRQDLIETLTITIPDYD